MDVTIILAWIATSASVIAVVIGVVVVMQNRIILSQMRPSFELEKCGPVVWENWQRYRLVIITDPTKTVILHSLKASWGLGLISFKDGAINTDMHNVRATEKKPANIRRELSLKDTVVVNRQSEREGYGFFFVGPISKRGAITITFSLLDTPAQRRRKKIVI